MNKLRGGLLGVRVCVLLGSVLGQASALAGGGYKETVLGNYVAVTREFDIDLSLCKWTFNSQPTSPTLSAECTVTYFPRALLDQYLRTQEGLDIKTYKDRAGNDVLTMLTPLTNGFVLSGSYHRNASTVSPVPVPPGSFSESQALAEELFHLYVRDTLPEGKVHVQVQALLKVSDTFSGPGVPKRTP